MTTTLTAPTPHAVRIGHTDFLPAPAGAPTAFCTVCAWDCDGTHVRADGVQHARSEGHPTKVGDGRTLTTVEVTS